MELFLAILASLLAIGLVIMIWLNSDLKKDLKLSTTYLRDALQSKDTMVDEYRTKFRDLELELTELKNRGLQNKEAQKIPNTPIRRSPKPPRKR